jgi:hypothetical protein
MLSENSPNTAVGFEIAVDPLLRGTFFCYNLKVVPSHVQVVKKTAITEKMWKKQLCKIFFKKIIFKIFPCSFLKNIFWNALEEKIWFFGEKRFLNDFLELNREKQQMIETLEHFLSLHD